MKLTLLVLKGIRLIYVQPPVISLSPNQNGTMPKDGKMRQGNVLGKIQPFELYYGVAFVFRCATRLCE